MQIDYIIIFIFIFILFLIIILLIASLINTSNSKINSSECPNVKGLYGVNTNREAAIIKLCGKNKNSKCSFNNIQSLHDAEVRCTALPEICSAFTYSDITKVMNIVDPNLSISKIGDYNVYIRQFQENISQ